MIWFVIKLNKNFTLIYEIHIEQKEENKEKHKLFKHGVKQIYNFSDVTLYYILYNIKNT